MMKTLLICHDGTPLEQHGLGRWLASFSTLAGIIVLRETRRRGLKRVRSELRRVGPLRFLDVLAFRAYYALRLAARDRRWEAWRLREIAQRYPNVDLAAVPVLSTTSPNTPEAEAFIRAAAPDIMIARCKTLLAERIFTIPAKGTFVMHPGICPEYRNSHGCFWALVNGDRERVGLTLLQIDKGVDTGPVYGYYRPRYDEVDESHVRIQHRALHDHLDEVQQKLLDIARGLAIPLDVRGRASATWGQPWLSRYVRWRRDARRRGRRHAVSLLYHDVVSPNAADESGFPGAHAGRYKLERPDFERHVAALSRVVPAPLTTADDGGSPLLLTFDDGGMSAATVIAPVLARHGWKAHFFVTGDYIGTPGFLTPDQIRALRAQGHVIGTHSSSHPQRMSALDWDDLVREWRTSAGALAEILGEPVTVASVPGGCYSREVAEAAAVCGITTLFTSEPITSTHVVDGCRVLGRYTIWRGMRPETSAAFASGQGRVRTEQFLFWNGKKFAKAVGGNAYAPIVRLVLRGSRA